MIQMPRDVKFIIHTLQEAGYEAFAVGGCVRDSLLGREPNDWDITTSALPEQAKVLFNRTIDTGIQHGTVTVMLHGEGYEVTTYRIDGEYEDGRHPKEVTFTAELREDLRRRDFTINAMAYNDEVGLVDIYGGREDLERKVVRCVGDPNERFTEDALRILRAVRFAAQLGFAIDPATREAIRGHAERLRMVSAERIQVELTKLLTSPNPEMFQDAVDTGITAVVLPEFDAVVSVPQNTPYHSYPVGEHILRTLRAVPADKVLRLTMLLHDLGKAPCHTTDARGRDHFIGHAAESARMAEAILKRLKYDNATIRRVAILVAHHDDRFPITEENVRRKMSELTPEIYFQLLSVMEADLAGKSEYCIEKTADQLRELERVGHLIAERQDPLAIRDLAVGGKDLMQAGLAQGPALGQTLSALLDLVLADPAANTRENLLKAAADRRA